MDGEADRVDYERAERGIRGRNAAAPCPACGGLAWQRMGELGNVGAFLHATTPDWQPLEIGDAKAGVYVYVYMCMNCGFLRLHSRDKLHEAAPPSPDETP